MKFTNLLLLMSLMTFQNVTANEYSAGWELWYPYQYHNKKGDLVGVDIQAFDNIMSRAGVTYSIAELPWKTHLLFIKTGKIDLAMGASWSEERCHYAYYSLPYRYETVKLFVKKGRASEIKLNQLKDLTNSGYIIGVESGYYYGEQYAELIKQSQFYTHISEAIDIETNVSLVVEGHLDGFLADPNTVNAFVEKYNMQDAFEAHDLEIYSAPIYIMLSKESTTEALLSRINDAITSLKQEGKLDSKVEFDERSKQSIQCGKDKS